MKRLYGRRNGDGRKGETIIGASITVDKDRSKGTATDLDGKFRLQGLSKGEVLTVTFIGYKPYSYKVTMSKENIKIVLEPQVSDLDEVVIVGEGSQKKISLRVRLPLSSLRH